MRELTPEQQKHVAYLKRCLKNARRRARYWSGNPSFRGFGFRPSSPRAVTQGHAIEYETALSDIEVLCDELEALTGQTFKRSDPKAEFLERFHSSFRPKKPDSTPKQDHHDE